MISEREAIGKRIRNMRLKNNLTISEFANYLGISSGNLSNIESGVEYVSLKMIMKICNYLNVNEDYIVSGDFYENIKPYLEKCSQEQKDEILKLITDIVEEKNEKWTIRDWQKN